MPILNREDAREVEARTARIFAAEHSDRAAEIRALFVEVMDFDASAGQVPLHPAPTGAVLPVAAERIAEAEGVHVLYVALDTPATDRVRKAEAAAAARLIAGQLGDDLLLLFTNPSAGQLHLVHPSFEGAQPTLRRLIVERDLPRRTAVQQVSNIYWDRRDTGSIRTALDRAFDVDKVTSDFFDEYKRVFDLAMEGVEGFGNGKVEEERKKLFVQTLFNRLMFVYFLSRKGWLTFADDREYINALWQDYTTTEGDDKNFHYDRLRLLFFAGLNNYRAEDLTSEPETNRLIGSVPFLNGGLFDKTPEDNRSGVVVPDDCISQVFDELFGKFNFTVMESTPFDIEVAVDPEMLGKVFEELVTGRHDSGSYYTPRPVVSFMCREALKGYLEGQDAGLESDAIAKFVDERDTSEISLAVAPRIAQALENVTVVDPACGSGAYLLGMMQELVDLHSTLFNVGVDPKSLYDLKLHIIQRNLYGVDIDEFAVNIAMLRMWLSLAVDYDDYPPEPLPNLDFKVVRGDSLLGPDPSPENYGDLFRHRAHEVAARVAALKADHMKATIGKAALKKDIASAEDELREALDDAPAPKGAVDWRVQFVEVFDLGGFDIAIANPPYVRYQKIGPVRHQLRATYDATLAGNSDLYCYFYARALQILRTGGVEVFVCSNSWLDVAYGTSLQQFLSVGSHVQAIYESATERQFSTALINTLISVVLKCAANDSHETLFVSFQSAFDQAIGNIQYQRRLRLSKQELGELSTNRSKNFQGFKWGAKLLRAPSIYHTIMKKGSGYLVRLNEIASVSLGITTGANGFFYLDSDRIREFGIEAEFLRPVLRTPREARTILVSSEELRFKAFYCNYDEEQLKGTAASEYIKWGEEQGYHLRPSCASRGLWYSLGKRHQGRLAMHELIDTTAHTFWATDDNVLFDKNFDVISSGYSDLAALCGSLNSTLNQLMVHTFGRENFGGGLLRVVTHELANLKIVDPDHLKQLGQSMLLTDNWDVLNPSSERRNLDDVVFDSLSLTRDERDAVYEGVEQLVANRRQRARSV